KIKKDKKKPRGAKGKDKGKNKLAYAPNPKIPSPPKRDNPAKDSICHHCKEGLKRRKKLKHEALSLYMGNGMRAAVKAIGNISLVLLGRWRKKIFVARNAEFFKDNLIVQEASRSYGPLKMSGSDEGLKLIKEEDTQPSENTSEEHNKFVPMEVEPQNVKVLIRRFARIPQAPDRYEMQSMKDNQVWILVELPPNGRTVGSKWIFKKKTNIYGNVHTFKSHLVAKGYTQTYGVDYEETFSPVANIRAIRILLAIVAESAYILRIKIIRDRSKRLIALSQSVYLEKILKKFRMENSKKGYTPIMEKPDYRKSQGAKTPSEQNPGEIHWTSMKTILKYLRNTKDMVLMYGAKPEAKLKVSCYVDANWKSAKKSTTAMFSIEAEYIADAKASMEAVWIRKFIDGLGDVVPSNKRPMEMLCENEPAIAIAVDPNDNVADPFTKPMSFNKHFEHAMTTGIVHASSFM
nr:hypothetical protein [Tanacetum cinerariifolium]